MVTHSVELKLYALPAPRLWDVDLKTMYGWPVNAARITLRFPCSGDVDRSGLTAERECPLDVEGKAVGKAVVPLIYHRRLRAYNQSSVVSVACFLEDGVMKDNVIPVDGMVITEDTRFVPG